MSTEKRFIWSVAISWLVFGLLLMVAVQTGFAQSSDDVYRVEEFNTSGDVNLEVQTSGGSIEVIGSNNTEVRVEMFVRHRGRYVEQGDADLSDYDINITQSGNTVKAIADRKSNRGWNWNNDGYSISFVVYAPQETRSRLRTSGGSLTVRALSGSQELRTSGGSISAEGIAGEMHFRTSGGSISINDSRGDADVNTSGGTIRVDQLVGNLDAKTSGGSIRLSAMQGDVTAKTSGGSIHAEIIVPSNVIDLKTSGGSITIDVPQENGYDVDLDGQRVHAELVNFDGEAERDEIKGSFNGGGTKIYAKTSGGSVRLRYL